jgi:hypothetical protein
MVLLVRQLHTRAWWRLRNDFELFASTAVRDEASAGDPREVAKRLVIIKTMTPLTMNPLVESLARDLLAKGKLPPKAKTDAIHLCTSMVHKMDYLLSWNFKHLVNASIQRQIYYWAADAGYNVPVICTPEHLLRSLYESPE